MDPILFSIRILYIINIHVDMDPYGSIIYANIDPINKNPSHVSNC